MTAVVQLSRPVPIPTASVASDTGGAGPATLPLTTVAPAVVAGAVPVLPWPAVGQAAVAVPATGLALRPGVQAPVPIASLTKIMTAYLVLLHHPLAADAQGPTVVMSAADQADSALDLRRDATTVPVDAGEHLTERQLLDGVMVHSANDLADALARWDAGSVQAFVTQMNAAARRLGMASTHFADASGFDARSVSTASDLLVLTSAAMKLPAFASVVGQRAVTLPAAGLLANYVQVVGTDGVVGVKSGFTQAAQGCVVLAVQRTVGLRQVMVLVAVTGQPGWDPLAAADATGLALVDAVAGRLSEQRVVTAGSSLVAVRVPWAGDRGMPTSATRSASLVVWPGDTVEARFVARRPATVLPGTVVGDLRVSDRVQQATVPVRSVLRVTGPSLWWHIVHG